MLGVVRCPKCRTARGVELSAAKAECHCCGRELHPRRMKPLCAVVSVSELPAAVQAANIRGREGEVPPARPRHPKASAAEKALEVLAQEMSAPELAARLDIQESDAQALLDRLAESGAVLMTKEGRYLSINPSPDRRSP
jgi:hypothetical protein